MPTDPFHDHPPYTPEFCEDGYNNLSHIPNHRDYNARWSADAVLARLTHGGQFGLFYGDDPEETLDFFPARKADAPLFVFIHGGYWRALNKRDFSWVAPAFVARGAAVAVLNYTLAPAVTIDEIVLQMVRAHAWLYRHADDLGFDKKRIVTSGHSAGGHLTAMMLAARWKEIGADLPDDLVSAGLSLSGIHDLEPIATTPFLKILNLSRATIERASPAYLQPGHTRPIITAVGAGETGELRRQTALLGTCWPKNVRRSLTVPGHHLDICDELVKPDSELFKAACELLGL